MNRTNAATKKSNTTDASRMQAFFEQRQKDQKGILEAVLCTIHHFFGDFNSLFSGVCDPRNPNKTTYSIAGLGFTGVMMYLCHLEARRQIRLLMHNEAAIETFRTLFGVQGIPHGDTLNDAFCSVAPEQVQDVVCETIRRLVRSKVLYPYRVLNKYYVVAIDGTGMVTYSSRHCPHCLTKKMRNGKTLYYHNVLEAKLVTPNGFAFSLMTQFIENPAKNPSKQDCELKAFYRLAPRLKAAFPRLPILLVMDGLFAGGPVFKLCDKNDWKFMIVLTDDDLRSVNEEFEALSSLQLGNHLTVVTGNNREIRQAFRWVNEISYTDSNSEEHIIDCIECIETTSDEKGVETHTRWKWTTNCRVTDRNVIALANDAGRNRWKIENEGFNTQKNGGYGLEHAYTADPNSAKVFYYLMQIAHMISQLLYKGSLLGKDGRKRLGSLKNLAFYILEAWRNAWLGKPAIEALHARSIQIRFCPDTS